MIFIIYYNIYCSKLIFLASTVRPFNYDINHAMHYGTSSYNSSMLWYVFAIKMTSNIDLNKSECTTLVSSCAACREKANSKGKASNIS